jgi:hypothetical protein
MPDRAARRTTGPDDIRRAFCHCEAHRNGAFRLRPILSRIGRMPREQQITFGEMRESGVFGGGLLQ